MNELGPSSGFNFGNTNRYSGDLEWPVANEYRLRAPAADAAQCGRVGRLHPARDPPEHRLEEPRGANESYIPLQVTEANSGRQVTVYNQSPALRGKFDVLSGQRRRRRHDLQWLRPDGQQAVEQPLVPPGRIHVQQGDRRHAGGDGRVDRPAGRRPQQPEPDVPRRSHRRRFDELRAPVRACTNCRI